MGAEEVELLNQAALAKVTDAPDAAYLRALEVLKERLQTGQWPVSLEETQQAAS
ncbi:MAG: hypothetical protein ACOX4B_08590 [Bacillota bacterium]